MARALHTESWPCSQQNSHLIMYQYPYCRYTSFKLAWHSLAWSGPIQLCIRMCGACIIICFRKWKVKKMCAPGEDRTHDLQISRIVFSWIMRLTRCLLRYRGHGCFWTPTWGIFSWYWSKHVCLHNCTPVSMDKQHHAKEEGKSCW